jgi:hypothetical protein
MKQFLWGMLMMAHLVAALMLLRFWRVTGERLFAYFSGAFAILALSWLAASLIDPALEVRHYVYVVRFLGFLLLIVGIVDKNRRSRPR